MHLIPKRWAKDVVLKLLEATHGQWIYRNVQIRNSVAGTEVTLWKEEIQQEIEEQMELGKVGLLKEDHWMVEVNLGDMETTSGEQEEYWLLAIRAAREAALLTQRWTQQTQEENLQQMGVNLISGNPCACRVGWLLVANLTMDSGP